MMPSKFNMIAVLLGSTVIAGAAQAESLTRVATVPVGGEITGLYLQGGDLFMNVQHPDDEIDGPFNKATVGVIANADFAAGEQAVPESDDDKITVLSTLGAYQVIAQEGDDGVIGVIKDAAGEKELLISNDPDFNGFIPTGESNGYLFTNWENRPGGMSRIELTRAEDGTYTAGEKMMVNFADVGGTWVNCFGSVSPWMTPLTSEELYFDNTVDWNNPEYKYHEDNKVLADYLGGTWPNPYNYGFIVEITDPKGTPTPVKMRALGRSSHENSVVMPDEKTVYTTSDGTGQPFFKFIADTAGDLTAGTLFAAKVTQNGDAGAESADTSFSLEWVELGHGTNAEIEGWIADYDGITVEDHKAGETNYITDEEVEMWAKGEAEDNRVAFLESIKAAKAKGATAEFRKMEGVNISLEGLKAGTAPFGYVAMSAVTKTMADGEGDIDLAANDCGVVYQLTFGEEYSITTMTPVIAGHGYDEATEMCPTDSISNPDNLIVLEDGTLVVGEDTGAHENNMLWVYKG